MGDTKPVFEPVYAFVSFIFTNKFKLQDFF